MMQLMAETHGPAQVVASRWRWPALALVFAGASVLYAFWEPLRAVVETWSRSPSFEHGYAIVAVTAALIWSRRRRIAREDPSASTVGVLLAGGAAALGALGVAGAVLVVEQFAFVLLLHGLVLAILGPRIWRILAFPLAYLFFAVPMGDLLVPWLRDLTAHATVAMLTAVGTPAILDGYLIRLPNADYRVAEACAGLRFLLVSIASSVLAASLLMRSWRRRLLFIGIAVALPLMANALRAALLIWFSARGMLDPGAAVLHLTYGVGFSGVLLILLMLLAWLMREQHLRPEPLTFVPHRPVKPLQIFTAMLAVSLLAFLPVIIRVASAAVDATAVRLANPTAGGSWIGVAPSPELLETAAAARADAQSLTAWIGQGSRIELLILYYRRERQGAEAVGATPQTVLESSWTEIGQRQSYLLLDDRKLEVGGSVQERAGQHRIAWTWYWVDGRFTPSALAAKLMQIGDRLLARPGGAARIRMTLIGEAALNDPEEVVGRFLTDLESIGSVLSQANSAK